MGLFSKKNDAKQLKKDLLKSEELRTKLVVLMGEKSTDGNDVGPELQMIRGLGYDVTADELKAACKAAQGPILETMQKVMLAEMKMP